MAIERTKRMLEFTTDDVMHLADLRTIIEEASGSGISEMATVDVSRLENCVRFYIVEDDAP